MADILPHLGYGLGLRAKHIPYILENLPAVDWFEIISENYMDTGGKPIRNLERIMEHYPIVLHGVSLSIGTIDPLRSEYLQKLKRLIKRVQPAWISDHLCWTGIAHKTLHDLLPIPYTEESLKHLTQRVCEAQDYLEMPIALENPSTYLEFQSSQMSEAEFLARLTADSGCQLLLDVNNVYVTCYNHRLDTQAYIEALPLDRVVQIHLSGHTNKQTHLIDTHDDYVTHDVWNLYRYVVKKAARIPNTMIEWDDKIPEFSVLWDELEKAKKAAHQLENIILPETYQPTTTNLINNALPLQEEQQRLQYSIIETTETHSTEWIRSKQDFSATSQLQVYQNAYRWRLFDVVAEDYPVLYAYLGKADFDSLIHGFVASHIPTHFNIARYAATLPSYLQTQKPTDIFAQELCLLETTIAQLADAEETESLSTADISGASPDSFISMKLQPRKALQLFAFHYPVNAYYDAVKAGEYPTIPSQNKSFLAVFRHEDIVWRMSLEATEYQLLQTLFAGATIRDALAPFEEELAVQIFDWFSRWMRNGLLAKPAETTETDLYYKELHNASA